MFGFFNKKTATLVGVDIGSSAVKLVALSREKREITLDSYAIVGLPPSAIVDGHVQELGVVAEAIEKGVKICGSKLNLAITGVPSSAVIIKHLELSNAFSEAELEDQIKIEADQFIPYPLDEVAIDFEVQGPNPLNPDLNKILLVACRNNDVIQREASVNSAGLKCEVVDVDTFAIERLLTYINKEDVTGDDLIASIDIGASTMTLNVMHQGEIIYNREQGFGSNELTNSIHIQCGMSVEEVEQSFRLTEISMEIEAMLIEPFRDTISQQISRALQFYYSSNVQNQLTKIYLSGGCSSIKGLVELLEEELGITVELTNPFSNMRIQAKINKDRLNKDAPVLVKACGLALRSFDE
ncbi:MAG: type IV pilus assembly protein PilM [Oceanospirillaceae bacterium]|nr:type IV pilus assembly protein PilM [Oceanospirillaceae bacterium]